MNQQLTTHFEDKLGWFPLKNWGLISIRGQDRISFLQSLVSNDITTLKQNSICKAALLEKNSKIIATFWISKGDNVLQLFIQKNYLNTTAEKLNYFIFSEDVQIKTEEKKLIYLQGAELPDLFRRWKLPNYEKNTFIQAGLNNSKIEIENIHCINLTANEGAIFVLSDDEKTVVEKLNHDINEIDKKSWEVLRVEAALTMMGIDFDESNMLLEVDSLDEMINTTKGCYPGQEIVARTLSRGGVQKKIFGLKHQDKALKTGDFLYFQGKKAAEIKSTVYSPSSQAYLSLAFLKKDFWVYGKQYRFEKIAGDFKSRLPVSVERLPFRLGKNLLSASQSYLEKGIDAYHKNHYEEAKELLNKALAIRPYFADAVEALSVTSEKMGNIEEAISLNKKFAKIDANAIMAHANLSRLYLSKGWIEKAEEEKNQATLLGYKTEKSIGESQAIKELTKQQEDQITQKTEMFQKVLSVDPQDEIANFGLGKIYYEQKKYQQSKDCLKIVIKSNKDYSAAYNIMGKTLIALNEKKEALSIFVQGIKVADKQGNLATKNSMEEQLLKIKNEKLLGN